MASEVIKHYLVSLGFAVDDASLAKYREGIGKLTLETLNFGKKATGVAVAVAAMVDSISDQYEGMYFAAVRTGARVVELEKFSFGSRAIGLSTEQSTATLERFNLALMQNPGNQFLLNYLGVQTAGRTTKEMFDDMIDVLGKMPPFLAFMYGQHFGMSPGDVNQRIQLRQKEAAAEADYAARLQDAGINMDELAQKSNNFQQAVRGLWSENELIIAQVGDRFLPAMTAVVKYADGWAKLAAAADKETAGLTSTLVSLLEVLASLKSFEWLLRLLGLGGAAGTVGFGSTALMGGGLLLGAAGASIWAGKKVQEKFGNPKGYDQIPGVEGYNPFGAPTTVPGKEPAAIRYNNPGAQYPSTAAKTFGEEGFGTIGGGHLIAKFPTPEQGAASNMELYARKYVGMPIGAAGKKWTGSYSFGVPGYDPNTVVTADMSKDPNFMIPFMKAIAQREAGRQYPMTDEQWKRAFNMYMSGSGDDVWGKYDRDRLREFPGSAPLTPDMHSNSETHIQQNNTITLHGEQDPHRSAEIIEKQMGKWGDQLSGQVK